MHECSDKGTGFPGQRFFALPHRVIRQALRDRPLLRGLLVTSAGFFPRAAGHRRRRPAGADQAIVIYCVKGSGWCELAGARHTLRAGQVLVLPPGQPHAYGAHASNPWTIHWVHAAGTNLREYLVELGVSLRQPVFAVGDDVRLVRLFNEILSALERGCSFPHLLQASQALGYLLSILIVRPAAGATATADGVQKVAATIIYMSEHVAEPMRVGGLAALAHLSPAHFAVLFKQQTGCSPRDYLHLLRMHRACELLRTTSLSIKEIAARLGYQDPFHFSRQFKAFESVSPKLYREGGGP